MMEMKKAKVAETVKEHRADELSAMFNLMMDHKRFQRGMNCFFTVYVYVGIKYAELLKPDNTL